MLRGLRLRWRLRLRLRQCSAPGRSGAGPAPEGVRRAAWPLTDALGAPEQRV